MPNVYSVTTWDADLQKYTPQEGIPSVVRGIAGLRLALRMLREYGYGYGRGDMFCALIKRIEEPNV